MKIFLSCLLIITLIYCTACKENNSDKQTTEKNKTDSQNISKDTFKIPMPSNTNKTEKLKPVKKNLAENKTDSLKKIKEMKKLELTESGKVKEENLTGIDFAPIYKKRCLKCHGSNGKGKIEGVPDFTSQKFKNRDDSELFQSISDGIPGETEEDEDMPSFKKKLTEEEINAAIKYIKKF